jgi:hypothetical protein
MGVVFWSIATASRDSERYVCML